MLKTFGYAVFAFSYRSGPVLGIFVKLLLSLRSNGQISVESATYVFEVNNSLV